MFSLKKTFCYLLFITVLLAATWSVGEKFFSFRSVIKLLNPAIEGYLNIPLFVLHLGLVFLLVNEINQKIDDFFFLKNYIIVKRDNQYFVGQCVKYAGKYSLILWLLVFFVELLFSAGELREYATELLLLNTSVLLTLFVWIGLWIILRLLHFSSKSVMVGMLLLICAGTFFSGTFMGNMLALCPADLFNGFVAAIIGKCIMLFLLVVGVYLVLRKYESIGGNR